MTIHDKILSDETKLSKTSGYIESPSIRRKVNNNRDWVIRIEDPEKADSDSSSIRQGRRPQTKTSKASRRKSRTIEPAPVPIPIPKTVEDLIKDAEEEAFYLRTKDFR